MSARKQTPPPGPTVADLVRRYCEYATAIAAAQVAASSTFQSALSDEAHGINQDILRTVVGYVDTDEGAALRDQINQYLADILVAAELLLKYDVKLIALRAAAKARTGADRNRTAASAKAARITRAETIDKQARAARAIITLADEIAADREAPQV